MAPHRPGLLVDAGPLIAWFNEADPAADNLAGWLARQEERPGFGRLFVLDLVVAEVHTFLRRKVSAGAADAFLDHLVSPGGPVLVQANPARVVARLQALPPERRTSDLTFADVALAEFAHGHGLRHVLSFDRGLAALGVTVVVPA